MSYLLEARSKTLEAIAELERELKDINNSLGENSVELETATKLFKRVENKPKYPRYGTGIWSLDEKLRGGLMLGTFANIAGNNFAGKTTFLLKILTNIAQGHKVLFFSFEMYENLLKHSLENMTRDYNTLNNFMIEQKRRHLNDIADIIRTEAGKGVKIFAIDSMMKIETNETEEYKSASTISKTLAKLTQELGVIILLINQISEGDQRSGRLGFKKSGDIAYDSDFSVFILTRDNNGQIERKIKCTKDRINGQTWELPLPEFEYGWAKPTEVEYKIEIPNMGL